MRSTKNRYSVIHAIVLTLLCVFPFSESALGVSVTVPDTTIQRGMTFALPLQVDQVDGLGIIAYQFSLQFDGEILEATGISIDGCLCDPWGDPTVNANVSGEITVVHYGVTPLSGAGQLIQIQFQVIGNPGEMTQLRFDSFLFNEGEPFAEVSDPAATFTVTFSNVPILSVFPESLSYGQTDTVQILTIINVGTDTLDWNISEIGEIPWLIKITPASGRGNDVVASIISRSGMSVGTYSGRILVSSNGGDQEIVLTMVVPQEHFIVDISIPDTSQYKSIRVQLPLRVSDITGMNIIAYDFTLLFDRDVINIVGTSTDSTLSETWEDPDINTDTSGQITVSHFGSTPLTGRGTLVSIICIAVGNPGDTSNFSFEHFVFNDGYPFARWDTPVGVFSVDTADVPLLFLSPTVLDFGSHETVKTFDIVNLGTDNLTWNVFEDPDEMWITSILPSSGVDETTISVAVSRIGLTAGLYSGKISVTSNGGNGSATVSISVPGGERYLRLSLPDTSGTINEDITIPVMVNDLTTFGVIDFQFALHFREGVVEVTDARSEATLSEPWGGAEVDISTPGRALISHEGLLPLAGGGPLINVRIRGIGLPGDSTTLTFSDVLFNGNSSIAQFDTPAGTFIIERPDSPLLYVTPTTLDFGSRATSKTLTITNLGASVLHWSVYESPVDIEWITSVLPADGTGPGTVTVTVDRSTLIPNTYSGGLFVASDGGNENITVRITVEETDTLPPYFAFHSPQNGAVSMPRNGPITIILQDQDSEVNGNSLHVVVDADTIVADGQDRSGGAVRFLQRHAGIGLVYTPPEIFDPDDEITVTVQAEDTALLPHLFQGSFSYRTGLALIDVHTQAVFGTEGGTLTDTSDVLFTLPPGILDDSLVVYIGTVTLPPQLSDTFVAVGQTYHFGPDGLHFCPLPGAGRLIYTEEDLHDAGVTDPVQLMVFGFNSIEGQWEELEILNTDPEEQIVLFNLCRFGYFTLVAFHQTSIEHESDTKYGPAGFKLHYTHPNPFNASTHIPIEIPSEPGPARVKINIYNLLGECVRTVFEGDLPPGYHTLRWDGRAGNGRVVPSGLYICRMSVTDPRGSICCLRQRKMLLLK